MPAVIVFLILPIEVAKYNELLKILTLLFLFSFTSDALQGLEIEDFFDFEDAVTKLNHSFGA
jgi:hypothetical protein